MFGISTHLYIDDRLERDHLVEIAAHGFDAVEVFAVKSHFDYRDRRAAIALAEWLDDTRLKLHSMHAPIALDYTGGTWHDNLSLAATDDARRKLAIEETLATLAEDERDLLRTEWSAIVEELAAEPRVLCHRDYHSRNLMLHRGQLYMIDFQDARMGPDTYDLASLLRDSYVDLTPAQVDELIAFFLALKGAGVRST